MILELDEWSASAGLRLSPEAVGALAASKAFRITPAATAAGHWIVRATHHVGVAHFAELQVRVRPKVGTRRLMELLCTSLERFRWEDDESVWGEDDDLLATIAEAFVRAARRALERGPLQGYVERDERLLGVRGRIAMARQISAQAGLPLPVEVTYDDWSPDVVENRLLAGACRVLLGMSGLPAATRSGLRRVGAGLADVSAEPPSPSPSEVRWTRLNAHYRPAVTLARVVLRGATLEDRIASRARGASFLVDMNKVFEDIVGRGLREALTPAGFTVRLQATDWLDGERRIKIIPDVVVSRGEEVVAVVDAKYKALDGPPSTGDAYQAVAYATRYGLDRVVLVHAGTARLTFTTPAARIDLAPLDLSRPPEARARVLRELAMSMGEAAARPVVGASDGRGRATLNAAGGSRTA